MKLPFVEKFMNTIGKNDSVKAMSAKEKWLLFFLAGLLIAVIVFPSGKGKSNEILEPLDTSDELILQNDIGEQYREAEYEQYLSRKLEQILSEIEGAGKVQAWVTLSESVEKVFFEEQDKEENNLQEQDSAGGSRKEEKIQSDKTVVTDSGGNPYVIKTLLPKVEGVFVVAEGAGNSVIKKNISEACEVLFGIEAHRIKVAKKKVED